MADIQMPTSGKTASNVSVQVIGAPGYTVPSGASGCPGTPENNVGAFGANGILGVGPFAQDCGPACADTVNFPDGWYYTCNTTVNPATCAAASATLAQQLQNPVSLFSHRQQRGDRRAAGTGSRRRGQLERRGARLRHRHADQ